MLNLITDPATPALSTTQTSKRSRKATAHHDSEKKPAKRSRTKKDLDACNKENAVSANAEDKEEDLKGLEDDEVVLGARNWTITERTALYTWLLGPEADKRFEQHKVNPMHVYKKVQTVSRLVTSIFVG